jgi:hypothetical protein
MDSFKRASRMFRAAIILTAAAAVSGLAELNDHLGPALDHPAIQYRIGEVSDPVSALDARLASGVGAPGAKCSD